MIELRVTSLDRLFDNFMQPMPVDVEEIDEDVLQQKRPITTADHSAVTCDFSTESIVLPKPYVYLEAQLRIHDDKYHGKISILPRMQPNLKSSGTLNSFRRKYQAIRDRLDSIADERVGHAVRFYCNDGHTPQVIVQPNFETCMIDVHYGQAGAAPLIFTDLADFTAGLEKVTAITQQVLNTGESALRKKPSREFIAYINFNRENYAE